MVETTHTSPRRPADVGHSYRVLLVSAPGLRGVDTCVLGGEGVQVGRLPRGTGRSWVLEDKEVSRAHAALEPRGEGVFVVRDLGSHNGTFVNGDRIEEKQLADGDVLRFGSHLAVFQELAPDEFDLLTTAQRFPQGAMVGEGVRLLAVRRGIARAAQVQVPALILGESGVGKELVAREIHEQSGRSGHFVAVNCAALPQTLVESELFGHARGAFTGAGSANRGLFEEAEGGTLLLDEIGDMPVELQAKLLRALATGEVRPVGTSRARSVDVKLVAATNVDLEQAVRAGTFRGDLYSRLLGATVDVPPLRARREDIPLLVRHFLGRDVELEADAVEALLVHHWPFNVRELEQTMGLIGDLGQDATLRFEHLPARFHRKRSATGAPAPAPAPEDPLAQIDPGGTPSRQELVAALEHYRGNIKQVAAFFGRDRRQIYRWAERFDVDPERYRA